MNSDVIIGRDGRPRCAWAGHGDTALGRYHDEVWGTRTYEASAMFEALTLGVFEVGLSWSVVFGKREGFRHAFLDFDVTRVAEMTDGDVDRLLEDASIIRNRGKIQATVGNARAMTSASPTLPALAKSYVSSRERAPRSIADLPKSTPDAEALAKLLKAQGYRFVGPTSVYAFMQNVGVVNDHVHGCFRATGYAHGAAGPGDAPRLASQGAISTNIVVFPPTCRTDGTVSPPESCCKGVHRVEERECIPNVGDIRLNFLKTGIPSA
jgi:DNA-3-methyladenine glycosylase I